MCLSYLRIAVLTCAFVTLHSVTTHAQFTISSLQPKTFAPGQTTRVQITGKELHNNLRAITDSKLAAVKVVEATPDAATLEIELPPTTPLGPLAVQFASDSALSDRFNLLVDDLPLTIANGNNHAPNNAQAVEPRASIEGHCSSSVSDYYRITIATPTKLSFEVITQALSSSLDPLLTLLDNEGNVLRHADDEAEGPESRFSYDFKESGEYLIAVSDSRFADGGRYQLRIGDFPIVGHASPIAIPVGAQSTVNFPASAEDPIEPFTFDIDASDDREVVMASARRTGGAASTWVPVLLWHHPLLIEQSADPQNANTIPIGINGELSSSAEVDSYQLQGKTGQAVRFRSRTRSLGCATLLKMTLLNSAGGKVAETAIADTDEWSFDFTFPDDQQYQLQVEDLIGRGGPAFGYFIEVLPLNRFQLALKADAATKDQFLLEAGAGACAIDVTVDRWGYAGAIDVELIDPSTGTATNGLSIVNPQIPAGANEARLYVRCNEHWQPGAITTFKFIGKASDDPSIQSMLSSISLYRIKQPEVPFPQLRDNGSIVVNAVAASDAPWSFSPETTVALARPVASQTAKFSLLRKQEAFKDAVAFLPTQLAGELQSTIAAEGDQLTATITQATDDVDKPTQLTLQAYSQFNGRGRIDRFEIPVQWFDPVQVKLSARETLIPAIEHTLSLTLARSGPDPQAVTIAFNDVPAGVTLPASIAIPADQNSVEVPITIGSDTSLTKLTIPWTLTSQYQGTAFTVSGTSDTLGIKSLPETIKTYPQSIALRGTKARQQLVVTGFTSELPLDWTHLASITSANPEVATIDQQSIIPKANGQTEIIVAVGNLRQSIPVTVTEMELPWQTEFENEVMVALSKQGCNSGACHGSPSGKGMFRLSLRAFDQKLDELTLIREDFGRRINSMQPEESLLLLKPLMRVGHGGGKHLHESDVAYTVLRDWIAEGAKPDPAGTARCIKLEVYPTEKRVLPLAEGRQQIAVTAHFEDGTSRDVTQLVSYESSNNTVATVDEFGLIKAVQRGEAVILVRYLEHIESIPMMFIDDVPGFQWNPPLASNYIDELVDEKLRQLQYLPGELCSDEEFIRRSTLDVIGLLPTSEETKQFLADTSPDKRARWIDELLDRDEYAKFWALKWGDLLKMTSKIVGDRGVYKYHRWVENAFQDNMPYDEFARQLITASGSTLANPPANFFRAATDMNDSVETISQVFLGARLQCAKCHNHPFERWTQDNYYGLGAFFNRVQRRNTQRPGEMFIYMAATGEVTQPRTGQQLQPWLPGEGFVDPSGQRDRRERFAQWLTETDNSFFARVEANRIWAQFFARGIVDPIDDFRDSNPPTNGPLLDALAKDFADHGYDRKHLLRQILNSRTYQATHRTNPFNEADDLYFSHQSPRLLSAEQLLDAVNQATGIMQPLGKLPAGTRLTHLPAPDVVKVDFLKVFGQPERATNCACERADDSNLGMAIELLNGPTIHERLRDPNNRFRKALAEGKEVAEVIREVYLATVSRYPEAEELQAALEHCASAADPATGVEDVCWALLNTDEFLFQH